MLKSILSKILLIVLFGCAVAAAFRLSDGSSNVHSEEQEIIIQEFKPSSSSIYDQGPYHVLRFTINRRAPSPLLVFIPTTAGCYPVIVFHHGFMLSNEIYTQMLTLIASHGFIIVAPQLSSSLFVPDATDNIKEAAKVIEWLPDNLASTFRIRANVYNVVPNFHKLVIMGHSKGGKVSFALALNTIKTNVTLPFSALIGLDPVDGSPSGQTKPKVLTFVNNSFHLPYPTLLVGTGLGSKSILPPFVPECAPAAYNHLQFYLDSSAPAFDIVPTDYGYMGFVNDKLSAFEQWMVTVCKQTSSPLGRAPMRRFTAGVVVAFLNGVLFNGTSAFENIFENPASAPIKIAAPLAKGSL